MNSDLDRVMRAAFRKSGLSIRQLSLRAGVPYSVTHGFARGTRDVYVSTAAKFCRVLGLGLGPLQTKAGV